MSAANQTLREMSVEPPAEFLQESERPRRVPMSVCACDVPSCGRLPPRPEAGLTASVRARALPCGGRPAIRDIGPSQSRGGRGAGADGRWHRRSHRVTRPAVTDFVRKPRGGRNEVTKCVCLVQEMTL